MSCLQSALFLHFYLPNQNFSHFHRLHDESHTAACSTGCSSASRAGILEPCSVADETRRVCSLRGHGQHACAAHSVLTAPGSLPEQHTHAKLVWGAIFCGGRVAVREDFSPAACTCQYRLVVGNSCGAGQNRRWQMSDWSLHWLVSALGQQFLACGVSWLAAISASTELHAVAQEYSVELNFIKQFIVLAALESCKRLVLGFCVWHRLPWRASPKVSTKGVLDAYNLRMSCR